MQKVAHWIILPFAMVEGRTSLLPALQAVIQLAGDGHGSVRVAKAGRLAGGIDIKRRKGSQRALDKVFDRVPCNMVYAE